MKSYAYKSQRDVCFEKGDLVYLKLKPFRLKSLANKLNKKLSARYYGPFEAEEKIGQVAYRLKFPPTARIHHVFHVSQLKKSLQPAKQPQPLLEALNEDMELVTEPEAVKHIKTLTNGIKEVLIKWKNLPDFESTWEPYEAIDKQFPNFHLEDKVHLIEGGNVGPSVKHYRSRNGPKNRDKETNEGEKGSVTN